MTGEADDDSLSAYWYDVRTERREKRAKNRTDSASMLLAAGIRFETKNLGAHLIVRALSLTVDFWPGTGRWIVRNHKREGRGAQRLIDALTPSDDTK